MGQKTLLRPKVSYMFRQMACDPSGGNNRSRIASEKRLTFLRIFQLLNLSFSISLHHQAIILLDKFPFLRVVRRGFAGNNNVATMLFGLFVS